MFFCSTGRQRARTSGFPGAEKKRSRRRIARSSVRPPPGRGEAGEIGAGRDHEASTRVEVLVHSVLVPDLLPRASDEERDVGQDVLLGGDPALEVELPLQRGGLSAALEEPTAFYAPQGMARVDEGDRERLREPEPDVPGVGVVGVDQVGEPLLPPEEFETSVHERVEVVPENLLPEVARGAERKAEEAGPFSQRLLPHRVVRGDGRVVDEPRQEIHALDRRVPSERPRKLDHVGDLSPRVGVPSQLGIPPAYEAVETEHENAEAGRGHGDALHPWRPQASRKGR